MKLRYSSLLALLILFSLNLTAQLLPFFGAESEPLPSEPICDIPVYLGAFEDSGYHEGDLVNDFALYTPEGERFQLQDMLALDKPVLLISAAYTCWRFRDQIDAINAVTSYYEDEISVFYVYTVEAHPHISVSPYSGNVWTGERNFTDNILYEQPQTYGERLDIIEDMRNDFGFVPTILVDDPCNQWWSHFGPAPNNAYLIGLDGKVAFKHPWANNPPNDLWCDISEYLHEDNNEYCNDAGFNGTFEVSFDSPEGGIVYGFPGEVLTVPTTITNLSQTDNVVIDITRQNVYTQSDWETALCINVCYNWTVSEASVTIPPGAEQSFTFYFYTGSDQGVGTAEVMFSNANQSLNAQILEFTGVTGIATSLDEQVAEWNLFPNPASNQIVVEFTENRSGETISLTDIRGALIVQEPIVGIQHRMDVSEMPTGLYFLRVGEDVRRLIIE